MNSFDKMKEMLEEEEHNNTIPAHYGMSLREFKEHGFDMLKDLMLEGNQSTVLDKHFKNLSSEDRAKVCAYSFARRLKNKIQGDN